MNFKSIIILFLVFITFGSSLSIGQMDESLDLGYAIKNISFNEKTPYTAPNGTTYQRIDFAFLISVWNPSNDVVYIRQVSEHKRLNFSYQFDQEEFNLNNNLSSSIDIYDVRSIDWNYTFFYSSGLTEGDPYFNAYLFLVNFTRSDYFPWGEYRFDINDVCMVKSETSTSCLDNKVIKYLGGSIINTSDGMKIVMDERPNNWGAIYSTNETGFLYFPSLLSVALGLFVIRSFRKSKH